MNRAQKLLRLSVAQQVLARRTSELFEPGYDPYNSLDKWKSRNDDIVALLKSDASHIAFVDRTCPWTNA